jgi:hypothetical protein
MSTHRTNLTIEQVEFLHAEHIIQPFEPEEGLSEDEFIFQMEVNIAINEINVEGFLKASDDEANGNNVVDSNDINDDDVDDFEDVDVDDDDFEDPDETTSDESSDDDENNSHKRCRIDDDDDE